MAISPSLFFYFPEKNDNFKQNFWELNGNFQYYFLAEDNVSVYGLAGLNFFFWKTKYDDDVFDDEDESDTELGLNLGIGANFHVGNVIPFAELKYVAGDVDQAVILLGAKFPIGE